MQCKQERPSFASLMRHLCPVTSLYLQFSIQHKVSILSLLGVLSWFYNPGFSKLPSCVYWNNSNHPITSLQQGKKTNTSTEHFYRKRSLTLAPLFPSMQQSACSYQTLPWTQLVAHCNVEKSAQRVIGPGRNRHYLLLTAPVKTKRIPGSIQHGLITCCARSWNSWVSTLIFHYICCYSIRNQRCAVFYCVAA